MHLTPIHFLVQLQGVEFHNIKIMQMRVKGSVVITLFVLQCLSTLGSSHNFLSTLGSSQDFDFYYLVLQWPVAYCETEAGCCYPTTGKPNEDFTIRGLWPTYDSGEWPENCNSSNSLDLSKISDLRGRLQKEWPSLACPSSDGTEYWAASWTRYGTCSGLDQHTYFQTALNLKKKANLLRALERVEIYPGDYYDVYSIEFAMDYSIGIGIDPYLQCNKNKSDKQQLYQVWLCVDKSASKFIECPVSPNQPKCRSQIEFPSFEDLDLATS